MRVFITGGTGLVGRHTVAALVARGDTVLALSRSAEADSVLDSLGAERLRGDLGEETVLQRGAESCDAVVHAGAVVLARGDWALFHATNVTPTETMARACGRIGRRLVHVSSVAVYGRATTYDGGGGTVAETFGMDRPIVPGDHYARSKREAEQALWRIVNETGLNAVALRPCVIYGEGDRAFAIRVARVLRYGVAPIIGKGDNPMSVVYAGNVATAVLAALDRPAVSGPFNVCNDGGVTQREFLERFARGLGVTLRTIRVPRRLAWAAATAGGTVLGWLRPGGPIAMLRHAVQFLGSTNPFVSDKAIRELGWTPVLAPAEAVERTGRWFRGPTPSPRTHEGPVREHRAS